MKNFSKKLLTWFDQHGRHDLPWQQNINSYRVWVSEIMLQQTQVKTVIPYYERFMQRFPDVHDLASATVDEVLQHWTGLGYYARGRNLHKAALKVVNDFNGEFPNTIDEMISLPGVGRSTAGAILSIAQQQRQPILDGNVKRVITRLYAIEGWPGNSKVADDLWKLADDLMPQQRVADYTQAIMDFGATVCIRSKPTCESCIFKTNCKAFQLNSVASYPNRKPKTNKPTKQIRFLICESNEKNVLMIKRPPIGIWGGLWSLPEINHEQNIESFLDEKFGLTILSQQALTGFRHTFSHYHLDIEPVRIKIELAKNRIAEHDTLRWIKNSDINTLGLAAPVKKLLESLN